MKNVFSILILILAVPFISYAQTETEPQKEFKLECIPQSANKYQFGISLGSSINKPSLEQRDLVEIGLSDRINNVTTTNGYGFSIGVLFGYKVNDILIARTQALISFTESNYRFDLRNEMDETLKRESVNLELPFHFVLENSTKKIAPSLVLGARYRYDVAQDDDTVQAIGNYNESDFLVDAGAGIKFHFDYVIFKTELLYSRGLTNQVADNTPLSLASALGTSNTNQVSLRFLFYM